MQQTRLFFTRPSKISQFHIQAILALASFTNFASTSVHPAVSKSIIPKSDDAAMDKVVPSNSVVQPGISIRNGPVEQMDTPMTDGNEVQTNGHTKRKARESLNRASYAEGESSDTDEPLVRAQIISPSLLARFHHQD